MRTLLILMLFVYAHAENLNLPSSAMNCQTLKELAGLTAQWSKLDPNQKIDLSQRRLRHHIRFEEEAFQGEAFVALTETLFRRLDLETRSVEPEQRDFANTTFLMQLHDGGAFRKRVNMRDGTVCQLFETNNGWLSFNAVPFADIQVRAECQKGSEPKQVAELKYMCDLQGLSDELDGRSN